MTNDINGKNENKENWQYAIISAILVILLSLSFVSTMFLILFFVLFVLISLKFHKLPAFLLSFFIGWDYVLKYNLDFPPTILNLNFIKIFALLSFVVLAYKILIVDKLKLPRKIPIIVIIYFTYLAFVTFIIHSESVSEIIQYFSLFIYFIVLFFFLRDNNDLKKSVYYLIIGNLIPSMLVIYNQFVNKEAFATIIYNPEYYLRPVGFLGNPNMFGMINLICIVVSFYLLNQLIKEKQNNNKIVFFLAASIVISFISLVLSASRGSYLALLIAIPFFVKELKIRKSLFFITGGIILFLLIIISFGALQSRLNLDSNPLSLERDASYNVRVKLYENLVDITSKSFLFGIGPNRVQYILQNDVGESNPQNTFLSISASFGIPAFIIFTLLIVISLLRSYKIFFLLNEFRFLLPVFLIFIFRFFFGTFEDSKLMWFFIAILFSVSITQTRLKKIEKN